jgi:hypothetical protein
MKRKCPICGSDIVGRSDKKFCSAICKTNHNRAQSKLTAQSDTIKQIDGILHRSHRILSTLMAESKIKKVYFPRLVLERAGFNFNYYTGTYLNNQKKTYHYVYNFAWMTFSMEEIMIIMK